MTWPEFKKKWSNYSGKESAAYQEHFNDLCHLLGQPTPAQADPTGDQFFCFQKRVVKDLELIPANQPIDSAPGERGFADVWKKDCFGWEYKGKKKDLNEAYKQLQRYREALLNPPLLVVCDFDRYVVRTNFNGTVQETHEFTNHQIDRPENLRVLESVFTDPEYLKPQRTTAQVTEKLAQKIAEIARLLQDRESVELTDAKTRKQTHVAQKRNLRIARFLNRIVFCLFAEDTGLLPPSIFTEICKLGLTDPRFFAERLEELFRVMAKGGVFGVHRIRHFNGHLFEEATVFELTEDEIRQLADASEADWRFIEPSIMGTLFERALDEGHRAQLGAHYTSEDDIRTLVEPVLMHPFRREWAQIKTDLARSFAKQKGSAGDRERLSAFQKKLAAITVLDPACGSGNFLYVSLQLLLGLEKEVITFATQLGLSLKPQVTVRQLKAIEINPYAYELAQVSVQIGYLQWRRDNGFDNDRTPVLQNLDGFENKDALMHETFKKKPKNLKEARKEEHHGQDELFKVFIERAWPEVDVIVGNPPFLGDKFMRRELGDTYVNELRELYGDRIPGQSDLCCYWFEKARDLIKNKQCKRAGLLATQGIRGGANRAVLSAIKNSGDIFFAISERPWVLEGANVKISMIGFDDGDEQERNLNGAAVRSISPQLTSDTDITRARRLGSNSNLSFIGASMHGPFPIEEAVALDWLLTPNPSGLPSSDIVRLWSNGLTIVQREAPMWLVDVPPELSADQAAAYEQPFEYLRKTVLPVRQKNRRPMRRRNWWLLGDPQKAMRRAVGHLHRYLSTPRVAKHRLFVWSPPPVLPTDQVIAFGRSDDFFFGILQSRIHEVWALRQCTVLGGNTPRYGPSQCFETFAFPFDLNSPIADSWPKSEDSSSSNVINPIEAENLAAKNYYMGKETPPPYQSNLAEAHRAAISAAARELDDLRERWLNPPEWTVTKNLEFAGSVCGPWSHYIEANTVNSKTNIGIVKYPRLEPKDAEAAIKLKKRTLTNLYNEPPAWLELAHKKLDAAVAAAYGWPADLADDQILERLLKLNLERAAAEKSVAPARKAQRLKAETDLI
jgi:type II restriction/modification system DNA methylase subunit YeeA